MNLCKVNEAYGYTDYEADILSTAGGVLQMCLSVPADDSEDPWLSFQMGDAPVELNITRAQSDAILAEHYKE